MRAVLFGHPLIQALGLGLIGILANVLSGAYVFEITRAGDDGKQYLDWRNSLHSHAFWALVIVAALMGLYGWGVAREGRQVRRRSGKEAIRARAEEVLVEPLLKQIIRSIDQDKLTSLTEAYRMLGVERGGER